MSNKEAGGQAFPLGASEYAGHGPQSGMTLRDYFAAQALQGLASHLTGPEKRGRETGAEAHARAAFAYADAMLAERAK